MKGSKGGEGGRECSRDKDGNVLWLSLFLLFGNNAVMTNLFVGNTSFPTREIGIKTWRDYTLVHAE